MTQPEEPHTDEGSAPSFRRAVRPVRRFFGRFALVHEEVDRAVDRVRRENAASEARLLPEMERMRAEMQRVERENAAIARLVAGPGRGAEEAATGDAIAHPAEAAVTGQGSSAPAVLVLPSAPGVNRRGLFEEVERGSRAETIAKVSGYVSLFDRGPVADLGCGRGEFLEAASRAGLEAYGVDDDADAVAICRELGLDARHEDLFDHLRALASESLGGVFCCQVVEHLPPELLADLMEEISRVLGPGCVALIETPNPASFATHVHSFWRDPTHIRPVPDTALSFAARTAGLIVETTVYSSLPSPEDRISRVEAKPSDPDLRTLVEAFNAMAERLNALLYGYQDYALVLRKPPFP